MKPRHSPRQHPAGYVALISVTLVMLTVVMVGVAVTLLGANSLLNSLLQSQGTQTYYVGDSCAYEALLRLKRDGLTYVGDHALTVNNDTCSITVTIDHDAIVNVLVIAHHAATTYRHIELTVDTKNFAILLWQEVD